MVDEEAKPNASAAGLLPTRGYKGIDDVNDEEKEDNGARVVMLFPTALRVSAKGGKLSG